MFCFGECLNMTINVLEYSCIQLHVCQSMNNRIFQLLKVLKVFKGSLSINVSIKESVKLTRLLTTDLEVNRARGRLKQNSLIWLLVSTTYVVVKPIFLFPGITKINMHQKKKHGKMKYITSYNMVGGVGIEFFRIKLKKGR